METREYAIRVAKPHVRTVHQCSEPESRPMTLAARVKRCCFGPTRHHVSSTNSFGKAQKPFVWTANASGILRKV